ncbi:UNVERIFIED_CONTAM: hypothetical protein Sindi_2073200 [Sesamum indicum]
MDESSGNSRSNSSSDMSSDEENNLRLIHELLSTSILKTKQPQHNSILQGSDWLSELLISRYFLTNRWFKRAPENELRAVPALFGDHLQAHEKGFANSESSCTRTNLSAKFQSYSSQNP